MNSQVENAAEILDRQIGGFRQFRLDNEIRLSFISQNFCDMTGYTKEELAINSESDGGAGLVCVSDRG